MSSSSVRPLTSQHHDAVLLLRRTHGRVTPVYLHPLSTVQLQQLLCGKRGNAWVKTRSKDIVVACQKTWTERHCLPVNAANARGSFRSVSCEAQEAEHECKARLKFNSGQVMGHASVGLGAPWPCTESRRSWRC